MPGRWRTILWIFGGALLAVVVALLVVSVVIAKRARAWAENWMAQQYDSQVQLADFRVTIPFPLVQCDGENLTLHFRGRQDLPPLIAVKRFTLRTSAWGLLRGSRRVRYLHLEGLQINVPPREVSSGADANFKRKIRVLRLDEIDTEDAVIRTLTAKPGKAPLEFDIRRLRLHSSSADGALDFVAELSNPRPPGDIVSTGSFGPWNPESPSLTPVSGVYDFKNADLSVFPGIAGILSSKGNYQGVLEKINVDGATDTPDFRLTGAGRPAHLTSTFRAVVDGTDGDTFLEPVEVHIGQTVLIAQGSVEGRKGEKGKTVKLDVTSSRARIEDLLALAVAQSPAMTGPVRLKTKFVLHPGREEVPERLNLDGSFALGALRFTSSATQQKIDNMSKRSLGKPQEVVNPAQATNEDDVSTELNGDFHLAKGILTFSGLQFAIPGADVQLGGTYALNDELMNFRGKVRLQAKLSQTTTGVKSLALKLADPLFSKQGNGAVFPIRITGTAQHPHYGL